MASELELAGEKEIYSMSSALDLLKVSPRPSSTHLGAYLEHEVASGALMVNVLLIILALWIHERAESAAVVKH